MFFQRITFDFSEIVIGPGNTAVLERAIAELANRFNMKWKVGEALNGCAGWLGGRGTGLRMLGAWVAGAGELLGLVGSQERQRGAGT